MDQETKEHTSDSTGDSGSLSSNTETTETPQPAAAAPNIEDGNESQTVRVDAPATDDAPKSVNDRIVEAIQTCYDPEIPVDIYELGLIYKIEIGEGGDVAIDMTLTSPACPAAGSLPPEVEQKVGAVDGVNSVKVEVVWEPTWTPEKMSEAAKLQLGFF